MVKYKYGSLEWKRRQVSVDKNTSTNKTSSATNASDISTNSADIATNVIDIASNAVDILTNDGSITALETEVANLKIKNITKIVSTATYDIVSTDHILLVTRTSAGTCAISWPDAEQINGRKIVIVDTGYNSIVNNITITPVSGNILNGASHVMAVDGSSISLISDGTNIHRGG